jgi:hypothetical protein
MFARWVERMEFVAFGTLRLSLVQFEDLTPKEFHHALRAETEKEQRAFERVAQLACWVINPWTGGGKPLQVRDLLRRPGERRRQRPDDED